MKLSGVVLLLAAWMPASAQAPAELSRRPTFLAGMNLGFEGPTIAPWTVEGTGAAQDSVDAHGGGKSLRVDRTDAGRTSVIAELPTSAVAGKRVRASGWVRTRDVSQAAGLAAWSDDGGRVRSRATRPLNGTTPWTRVELT